MFSYNRWAKALSIYVKCNIITAQPNLRKKNTCGSSAPCIRFPTPSRTRYVGISDGPPVTELKNSSFDTMGEFNLGRMCCLREIVVEKERV